MDAQELFTGLIEMLVDEKHAHERARYPIDRTDTVDRALAWLKDHDPKGQYREAVIRELRATLEHRAPEADYYLEEGLLQRLEAKD